MGGWTDSGWLTRWMGDEWRMDGYKGRWIYDGQWLVGWLIDGCLNEWMMGR